MLVSEADMASETPGKRVEGGARAGRDTGSVIINYIS